MLRPFALLPLFLSAVLAISLAAATVPLPGIAASGAASAPSGSRIRFASPADTTLITSSQGPAFLIVVDTPSPDPDRVDTLEVLATTAQGDHEVLKAMETAPASGIFIARVEMRGTHGYLAQYDDLIEVDGDAMTGTTVSLEVTVDRGVAAEKARLDLFFREGDAVRMRNPNDGGGAGNRGADPNRAGYSIDGRRWDFGKKRVRLSPVRAPAFPG